MVSDLTFYHSPHTRSSGVLALLEELGADYQLHLLNMRTKGEHLKPEYLSVNPMGKVPAIKHKGVVVTEQAAVYMYLADLFPQAGLAPAVGDPARGAYYRWMVFYGSCFEPAVIDRSQQKEAAPRSTSAYADYDTMYQTVADHFENNQYFLGENFSAADVLWGSALTWTVGFGLVTATPAMQGFIDRFSAREAVQRAQAKDAEWAAQHEEK